MGEGFTRNQDIGEIALKGGLGQFADLRGRLGKKEGVVFLRGFDTLMHTMASRK